MQNAVEVSTTRLVWREIVWVAATAVAVAVGMTWPLVLHARSDIGKDIGDPLLETWQLGWIGHALVHEPLDLWQANTFWPHENTLAFTDALVGYAPAALLAQASPSAALAVYNALFLFAYALGFVGAYLLARELGAAPLGALAAGSAFAYAPWRLAQNGHLHVISSGGLVLALFLLVRGYRRESVPLVVAGWLVAAWQMTLGFALGFQLSYLLALLALALTLAVVTGRAPRPSRRLLAATVLGATGFVAVTAFQARPYLEVVDVFPEARREPAYVQSFSPELRSFLSAPEQSWLWDGASHRVRVSFAEPDEMSLFPGLTISLLALVGVVTPVYRRPLRWGLAAGVLVCAALSLGVRDVDGLDRYLTPYRFLYDFAPGWDGVRTPGRLNTLTSLGLALLAAAGLCAVVRFAGRRMRGGTRARARLIPGAVGLLLVAAILVEGLGPLAHPTVPTIPRGMREAAEPRMHLPVAFHDDSVYSYWSTDGFPEIVNGAGGFEPDVYDRLRTTVAGFPDRRSVGALRALGVRTVVLHPERTTGTSWEGAAEKPVRDLPLQREITGDVVLYRLAPRRS